MTLRHLLFALSITAWMAIAWGAAFFPPSRRGATAPFTGQPARCLGAAMLRFKRVSSRVIPAWLPLRLERMRSSSR